MSACQIGVLFISTVHLWIFFTSGTALWRFWWSDAWMVWRHCQRVRGKLSTRRIGLCTMSPDGLVGQSVHFMRIERWTCFCQSALHIVSKEMFWGANSCGKWEVRSAWQSLGRQLSVFLIPRWPEDSHLVRWFSMDLWMHFGLSWIPKDTLSTCERIWQDMYVVLANGILWGQWTPCWMITRSFASLRVRSFPSRHRWGPLGRWHSSCFCEIYN